MAPSPRRDMRAVKVVDPDIIVYNQVVPDDFANALRSYHQARAEWNTLNSLLACAYRDGWTASALARALGVTRERVLQRIERHIAARGWPDKATLGIVIPEPPRRPAIEPPQPRHYVPPELVEELRRLWAEARTVNGATPPNDPRRQASVALTAALAELVAQGITYYHLAKLLGVTHGGVRFRLARHGYYTKSPSQANVSYLGRQPEHWGAPDDPAATCMRGHPRTPENTGWNHRGGNRRTSDRYCKVCARERARNRYHRLKGEAA